MDKPDEIKLEIVADGHTDNNPVAAHNSSSTSAPNEYQLFGQTPQAVAAGLGETDQVSNVPSMLSGWKVFALFVLISIAYLVGSTVAAIIVVVIEAVKNPGFDAEAWAEQMQYDGFILSICTLGATIGVVPAVCLSASLQKRLSIAHYLGFRQVSWLSCVKWIGITLLLLLTTDGVTSLFGEPVVPEFMIRVYTSPGALPWLWIAVVVLAPISEELVFRGFLYTGMRSNGASFALTAFITSLLWAAIHVQYNFMGIALIFVYGILLAFARERTKSIYPCLAMHAFINLAASIQVAVATA